IYTFFINILYIWNEAMPEMTTSTHKKCKKHAYIGVFLFLLNTPINRDTLAAKADFFPLKVEMNIPII
ncbi:hypothetical protein, partial [Tenacibaculum finnmarkense]|uniref:hypothetical protein n=1 Tax=Tenacibaculum finnmarkense TaxID=2781243 RepID=UPI001EFB64FE